MSWHRRLSSSIIVSRGSIKWSSATWQNVGNSWHDGWWWDWLTRYYRNTLNDGIAAGGIAPLGYKLLSCHRLDGPGEGIGLVYRSNIRAEIPKCVPTTTFEVMGLRINNGDRWMSLLLIYRPPPRPKNGFTIATFLAEFKRFIDMIALMSTDIVLTLLSGIHIDNMYIKQHHITVPWYHSDSVPCRVCESTNTWDSACSRSCHLTTIFCVAAPQLWNHLPYEITATPSVNIFFKSLLKTYPFHNDIVEWRDTNIMMDWLIDWLIDWRVFSVTVRQLNATFCVKIVIYIIAKTSLNSNYFYYFR